MTVRTILITGASSGIGRETAMQLLHAGHRVIGMARDFSRCDFDTESFLAIEMDFSNTGRLEGDLKSLAKHYPDITDIVCCAGQGRFGSLEEFSYEQIKALMDINFLSQAYVVRAFLPSVKRHALGSIIFMGSEAALSGARRGSIYCASKFALRGFAQSLREECSASGVRVGIVNPGMVNTPFFDKLDFAHGENPENYIEAKDVAQTIVWMLTSRQQTVIDEINMSPMKKVITKKT